MNTDKNMRNSVSPEILRYSIAAVILTIGMREIAAILVPIFFSVFAFLILAPLIYWLQKKGVPGVISVGLVILLLILAFIATGLLVTQFLFQLSNWNPDSDVGLTKDLEKLIEYFPSVGLSLQEILRSMTNFVFSLTTGILTAILNAGTTAGLIVITTTFLLLDIAVPPGKVRKEAKKHPLLLSRTNNLAAYW
ncbi:AI-2E family transporter [Methanosarcina sp. T3]|uniref:AI-2E family transporter n=1 Tax=Methanosarcina sp. T3 TaxID=3439062 RepID=UPI003F837358